MELHVTMSHPTRRGFLKSTSAAIAAGALPGCVSQAERSAGKPASVSRRSIPPHLPISPEGVHAYTDRPSVAAGDTIRFHVSSTLPHEFQICRLGPDVETPGQDEVLQSWRVDHPAMQPIHPGSYIHVEQGLRADREIRAITLECWVRMWNGSGWQGVITQFDEGQPDGFGLFVNEDFAVAFCAGGEPSIQEAAHRSAPGLLTRPGEKDTIFTMPPARWHHVAATVDGTRARIFVDGRGVGEWTLRGPLRAGTAPLRIGAFGRQGQADGFLDADISMPAIHSRALTPGEVRERFHGKAQESPARDDLFACWPLTEEKGDRVADVSSHQRHGRIINHATWMIGGPGFNADVPRFGNYEPTEDPTRGHGLRLASDDLYDCRWKPTFEYRVSEDARSGAYVGRIRMQVDGEERISHTLFIVKKAAAAAKAPIAFVFSTNSWRAYSATPFCPAWPGIKMSIPTSGYAADPDDRKAPYCFYRLHRGGQPAYQVGMNMPWPTVGPYTLEEATAAD